MSIPPKHRAITVNVCLHCRYYGQVGHRFNCAKTRQRQGSNLHTEHFSAVKAEVEDPADPSTQLNTAFIRDLEAADVIAFAGEASTHCLASTVRDIADAFGNDEYIKKCVLLKDATSPIPGLEHLEVKFLKDMEAKGMKIETTTDFLK